MTPLRDSIQRLFKPIQPLPAGNYHYQAPPEDPRNYRLHLRLEADGSGILIVNAATVLHLNQTAAEYAFYVIQNLTVSQVAQKMTLRYAVSQEQARQDYLDLIDRIQTLVNTPDLDPVTFLDFDRQMPFTGAISAPYRLDCALTYNLRAADAPNAAPTERVKRELTTAEWKAILDKAWLAGIPHIVFTGGEPTLREDLPELIKYAESKSQVTGLLSDGLRLAENNYLQALLQTGLDHLMLVLQPENELAWIGLRNALEADLFVAVHLTLTPQNAGEAPALLKRLAEMGVKAISLSGNDPSLRPAVDEAREQVANLNMELVWNLPVPYSSLNPVALETGTQEIMEGAGRAWMYVEPDADVLPYQGMNRILGNLLNDAWEKIWKAKV